MAVDVAAMQSSTEYMLFIGLHKSIRQQRTSSMRAATQTRRLKRKQLHAQRTEMDQPKNALNLKVFGYFLTEKNSIAVWFNLIRLQDQKPEGPAQECMEFEGVWILFDGEE